MQAAQVDVRAPCGEQGEHVRGIAQQPTRHAGGQVAAATLEIRVDRFRHGGAVEMFLEALQQAVVDPAHDRRAAIEALHHLLNGQRIAVVGIPQPRGEQLLVIEAQAFLAAPGDQVQAVAQAAQHAPFALQRDGLVRAQVA